MMESMSKQATNNRSDVPDGAIVVVSKVPTAGKSKTRLTPLLGKEGSAALAKAMLSDVLLTLDHCAALNSILKIVLYAPGNNEGLDGMTRILNELKIPWRCGDNPNDDDDDDDDNQNDREVLTGTTDTTITTTKEWLLLPMKSKVDLQSSDLGDLLEHALDRARSWLKAMHGDAACGGSVIFLGMDSPVLPLDDIVSGLFDCTTTTGIVSDGTHHLQDRKTSTATHNRRNASPTTALLCPADDGGYGMLSVPWMADSSQTFGCGIGWSQSLTAISQVKALTDQGIPVRIGTLMHDIDEPEDVQRLCERLKRQPNEPNDKEEDREEDDDAHPNKNDDDDDDGTRATSNGTRILDRPSRPWSRFQASHVTDDKEDNDGSSQPRNMVRISLHHESCYNTKQALAQAGFLI